MRIPVLLLCPFSASSQRKLLFSPLSASIFNTSVLIFRFCRQRQACFPYFNRFFFVFSLLLITKSLPFLSIFLDFFSILFYFPFFTACKHSPPLPFLPLLLLLLLLPFLPLLLDLRFLSKIKLSPPNKKRSRKAPFFTLHFTAPAHLFQFPLPASLSPY